jgi:hypothetical protein
MKQYAITITGTSPLLMHHDHVSFSERVKAWAKDPANKGNSVAGDDRTPAWTWIGYTYHDGHELVMPSDNLMTMLREGGAKVVKRGKETFKKHTQSGIMLDQQAFRLRIGGAPVSMDTITPLLSEPDFAAHLAAVEALGFELLVKRARIGAAKHIRVRPMFRDWSIDGSITVLDEQMSGLDKSTLEMIMNYAGALCGLGDWRPSSGASGTFGRFAAELHAMK